MAGLGDILGAGDAIKQLFLWSVLNSVISTAGAPYFTELQQLVNHAHPLAELSPADLAQSVVRNFIGQADGAGRAAAAGVDAKRFAELVANAGEAPAPGDLATALRREIIPEHGTGTDAVSFDQGIREGHLGDKWIGVVKALATVWPTPADALQALLEGQVSEADGRALYEKFGGDPAYFKLLFDSRGNAPTPDEALTMANRGVIPWDGTGPDAVSFEQAFLEGPWRNKWEPVFRALGEYLPPPRTVTAMLSEGSLSDTQAAALLAKQGLPPDLVQAYLTSAHQQKTAADKALTLAQVIALYEAGLVGEADATHLITAMGYAAEPAALLLAMADLRRAIAEVNTAISRVRSLYTGHKISRADAVAALHTLDVPAGQVSKIIATWDLEASISVKTLTPTEVARAFKLGLISQAEASAELTHQGYTPFDAWVLLALAMGHAIPDRPAAGPAAPVSAPLPGTTGA